MMNQKMNMYTYPKRMIGFKLTDQCNLKCKMCWQIDRSQKLFLSKDDIIRVIDSIKKMGYPPIYLWGGEPFLHPEIWEIVRAIKERGFYCIINTNGVLLEKNIDNIINSKLDMLIVSIDGPQKIHDEIRQVNGTFKRIERGLKALKNKARPKPHIVINSVITESNYRYLKQIYLLKEGLGADNIEFQLMTFYSQQEIQIYKKLYHHYFKHIPCSADTFPLSQGDINLDILIQHIQEIKNLNDPQVRFFPYILNTPQDFKNYFVHPSAINFTHCESIEKTLWIEANGDVIPCSNFPDFVVGNIYTDSFEAIWNSKKLTMFRRCLRKQLFTICYRCCDLYKRDGF